VCPLLMEILIDENGFKSAEESKNIHMNPFGKL
jgi:hypothetical protein